ncbi:hypothetical protein PA598K_05887 [Paenibacillus sp. 598K]|uniref:AfsR/SARP family transcriptional regulator n=1 Tax=Paenibacillus sp. 598K TaxID=1117987 RepID=UPI000FF9AD72|nr:bacterial transcriptional activator domain-containing protein [Paenibacillus sp. 598K]GBF77343.1 hypothetical protein PA598K_05887 [Paenibacillus sp. 598K]
MSKQNESSTSSNWSDLVLKLEQQYLAGKLPKHEDYAALPASLRRTSPLLLRMDCVRLMLDGRTREAAEQLSLAVKGYAAQANEREMLSMMGLLALLYTQIGGTPEARTMIDFLTEEYERTPGQCSGFVLWALARGSGSTGRGATRERWGRSERYYLEAAARFAESGDYIWYAGLLLDRWIYDDNLLGQPEWERWLELLRQWATLYPVCGQIYTLLRSEPGAPIDDLGLPERVWILVQAMRTPNRALVRTEMLEHDVEVQLFTMPSELDAIIAADDAGAAAAWLRRAAMLAEAIASPAAQRTADQLAQALREQRPGWLPAVQERSAEAKVSSAEQAGPLAASPTMRIQLFSGLKLSAGAAELIELKWKRRKARELLVYLLLQPGHRALREHILEQVFGEGEAAKLANHLYVSLHELRHRLKTWGWEGAVYARGGMIGIDEAFIGYIDIEQYYTLSQVGDQLWADDREAAVKLYLDAVQLYGPLGADMPYADWLERCRSQLLERQTLMVRRLIEYYSETSDKARAEQWLNQWIDLRPDHEEAYQAMIQFWKGLGHEAEAISWYRRLERVCEEEFGTAPLEETRRLIWP